MAAPGGAAAGPGAAGGAASTSGRVPLGRLAAPAGGGRGGRGAVGLAKDLRRRALKGAARSKGLYTREGRERHAESVADTWAPVLLTWGALACLLMPALLLLQGGLPEPKDVFYPPSQHFPSKAVARKPKEGVHFDAGHLEVEGRAIGPRDAAHFVVEFTDFFCAHCQQSHQTTMVALLERYAPTGHLRLESHPVAFLDNESIRAAHAVLCAQEQHKYWEIRELLFQVDLGKKPKGAATVFNGALLKRLADLAELDLKSFARCFRSGRHKQEIERISQLARRMGVVGTPHFIINNVHREGVVDPADFDHLMGVL